MNTARSASRAMLKGLATFLNIEVKEGERRVVRDQMKVIRLDEKSLKKINIPGFANPQIQELIVNGKVQWRHLGLDYKINTEEEKITWG